LSTSISAMKGNRFVLSDKKTVYLADETSFNMTSKTASGCQTLKKKTDLN